MATSTMHEKLTLDQSMARKFAFTPAIKIRETNVFSDVKLNESDRIARATAFLNSREWK